MQIESARHALSPQMPPPHIDRADRELTLRYLLDAVVDYAIFMIDPRGVVTNWNRGAERIKGWRADEIVGQHFSRFYTEADRAGGVPDRALRTAAEQGRYEAEGWRVRKDGSLFWASVVLDAIVEEDRLIGFAKVTRDITEKRNAQLELQRAHDRLAQAQKMEALGKLTGGVAHDFNNILMIVSGQAQLLRRKLADDPRGLRALEAIEAAARRGEDLTRHLLSFSRRQRLTPVAVSLHDRSAALRDLMSASLPPTVELEVELPENLWPVTVDPGEFDVALLNFAVNARDAMPKGGRLRVSAQNQVLDGTACDLELNGEFVAVSVRDDGVGIPPDIMLQIFDPFFTTKEVDKGTGLGLSQIYGFAQQSGGRVTVSSDLGEGATFTLYLPRADSVPDAVAEAAGPTPDAAAARVLLVEDNPEVADVAASMLEELGHQVRVAGSGAEALRSLHEGEPVDLVFSDIVMAGEIDGLGLARRIRDGAPDVPILLATGYSLAAERIGAEFPILRKPYRLPDLDHAIAALLRRAKTVAVPTARRGKRRGREPALSRRRGYAEP
jgi:PAS domain S-box-containing protein